MPPCSLAKLRVWTKNARRCEGGRGVPLFSFIQPIIICPHPAFGHFLARPSGERGLQRAREGGKEGGAGGGGGDAPGWSAAIIPARASALPRSPPQNTINLETPITCMMSSLPLPPRARMTKAFKKRQSSYRAHEKPNDRPTHQMSSFILISLTILEFS